MSEEKRQGYWAKQAQMAKAEGAALWREGLKDARNLVMAEFGKGVEEPGTIGNPTQQMVTEQFESDHDKWLRERQEQAKGPENEPVKGKDHGMSR